MRKEHLFNLKCCVSQYWFDKSLKYICIDLICAKTFQENGIASLMLNEEGTFIYLRMLCFSILIWWKFIVDLYWPKWIPFRLQKHFKKMFAGIASVMLNEEGTIINGIASREGKYHIFTKI